MDWRVGVLGPIESRNADGDPIPIARASQRRLIALLAVRGGNVAPSEWLMEHLDVKHGALRTAVSRLRASLGDDVIETRSPGYRLAGHLVDAMRFQAELDAPRGFVDASSAARALRASLDRWRGDAYQEFADEPWAQAEAARLNELRLSAREDLVERLTDAGGISEAIARATALAAEHPYRDRPCAGLMRALSSDGRQTEALRAYHDHRRRLIDDVGTEPGPELVALERAIASGATQPAPTSAGRPMIPSGTATLLLTDIEGSTDLWHNDPDAMALAAARSYEILDEAIAANDGVRPEEQGEGDSVVAAFARASDAVAAALDAQRRLTEERWPTTTPVRVRMGLHTGEVRLRGTKNYVGPTIITAARIRDLGAGGQVLATPEVIALASNLPAGASFISLGRHHLKGLPEPVEIAQLTHPDLDADFPQIGEHQRGNLPSRLASFIGRAGEADELTALLDAHRLVTVTGSGGAGKTSLAHRVASARPERSGDGVWWFELAALTDDDEMLRTVVDVLGARASATETPIDAIVRRLGDDTAVIVLDNCEHLVTGAATLAGELLAQCPNLRILATSRMSLGLSGETAWRLPSMEVGPESDAVALFGERAAAVGFRARPDDSETIIEICAALDGIPLAIELAAARSRVLTPAEILDGVSDALRLLRGDGAGTTERQRTIHASIEWSIALLDADLARFLTRLSVCRGPFDLEAAVALAAGRPKLEVVDDLDRLLDHSLVRPADGDAPTPRFMLLETIRQFGASALADDGTAEATLEAHAHHFAAVAERNGVLVETADELRAVHQLDLDIANIRASLSWLREHEADRFVRTVAAVAPYWTMAGLTPEGVDWVADALDHLRDDTESLRARLVALEAHMLGNVGDTKAAIAACHDAIELGESSGDMWAVGRAYWRLSDGMSYGDLDAWAPVVEAARAACEAAGDRFASAYVAIWLGVPPLNQGDIRTGSAAIERAIPVVEAAGNPTVGSSLLAWQAFAAYHQGRFESALELADRALSGGGFRLPLQRIFVERLRSGASLHLGRPDPAPSFPLLAAEQFRRGEIISAMVALDWEAQRLLLVDPEQVFAAGERVLAGFPGGMTAAHAGIAMAWAALALGDDAAARHHLELAADSGTASRWPLNSVQLELVRAATALADDPRAAAAEAATAIESADRYGQVVRGIDARRIAVLASRLLGDDEAANRQWEEVQAARRALTPADAFIPLVRLEERYA